MRSDRCFKFLRKLSLALAALSAAAIFLYGCLFPYPYRKEIEAGSCDPLLTIAVIRAESGFRANAVSGAGAVGLMQLMPETAEYVRAMHGYAKGELTDPAYNILLGSAYLSYLLGKYRDIDTALAAYNAGEGNVFLWLKNSDYSDDGITLKAIPFPETAGYVEKINETFKIYKKLYGYILDKSNKFE